MADKNYGYDVRYDLPGKLGNYIRGAKLVKDWAKEHPAGATAIAAAPALPATLMGILGAGALGLGAEIIDKSHPLTSQPSDWETRRAADNLEDVLSSGAVSTVGAAAIPAARLVSRAAFGREVPVVTRALIDETPSARRLAALREAAHGGNAVRGFRWPARAIPLESSASDASSVGMGVGYPVGPIIQPRAIPVAAPAPVRSVDPFLVPLHDPYAANPLASRTAVYAENTPIEEALPGILPDRVPASQIKPTGPLQEVPEMWIGRGPANYVKRPVPSPDGSFKMQKWDWKAPTGSPLVRYPADATSPAFLR